MTEPTKRQMQEQIDDLTNGIAARTVERDGWKQRAENSERIAEEKKRECSQLRFSLDGALREKDDIDQQTRAILHKNAMKRDVLFAAQIVMIVLIVIAIGVGINSQRYAGNALSHISSVIDHLPAATTALAKDAAKIDCATCGPRWDDVAAEQSKPSFTRTIRVDTTAPKCWISGSWMDGEQPYWFADTFGTLGRPTKIINVPLNSRISVRSGCPGKMKYAVDGVEVFPKNLTPHNPPIVEVVELP
jgi:hypothetical protein